MSELHGLFVGVEKPTHLAMDEHPFCDRCGEERTLFLAEDAKPHFQWQLQHLLPSVGPSRSGPFLTCRTAESEVDLRSQLINVYAE